MVLGRLQGKMENTCRWMGFKKGAGVQGISWSVELQGGTVGTGSAGPQTQSPFNLQNKPKV